MKSETLGTPLFILKTNQKYLLFCTFILDCFLHLLQLLSELFHYSITLKSLLHTSRILVKQVESGNWPTVPVDRYLNILLDRIIHLQSDSKGVPRFKRCSLLYWNSVHTLSCEHFSYLIILIKWSIYTYTLLYLSIFNRVFIPNLYTYAFNTFSYLISLMQWSIYTYTLLYLSMFNRVFIFMWRKVLEKGNIY